MTEERDPALEETLTSIDEAHARPAETRSIGRYQLQRRIGAGGMGEVWAALDPELDRTVAIKLVHERIADDDARERLRREAQALARLAHPNVVSVYDAGVEAGRLYIVMQLVAGDSLDRWLARARPDAATIVDRFVQAGRGLAAAHAAGLVHRDFKPSNVLVEPGGIVRVTDFGLARRADLLAAATGPLPGADTPLGRSLTQGEVLGTPAYMAPEQFAAGAITAATDQFGFCVSLWEALAGRRPFDATTFSGLRDQVMSGRIGEPPRAIPGRVARALVRGLSLAPGDRFPGMGALLAAIAPRRRTPWIAGGAVVVAAAIAGAALASRGGAPPSCAHATAALDRVWSPTRGATVRAALRAIDHPDADALAERAGALLDDRAARWRVARLDVCERAEVHHSEAAVTTANRIECLERSLDGLDAAAAELSGTRDPQVLVRALSISGAGIDPDDCTGKLLSRSSPAAPPELAARAMALEIAVEAGHYDQAMKDGLPLAAEVDASGDLPLASAVWWTLARAAIWVGSGDPREISRHAAQAASVAGDDSLAARAWAHAADVASLRGDLSAVDDLLSMARAAATRSRGTEDLMIVQITTAVVGLERGQFDDAIAVCGKIVATLESDPATRPAGALTEALECLDDAYLRSERWADAVRSTTHSEQVFARGFGADHPQIFEIRVKRGIATFWLGDHATARQLWKEAVAGLGAAFGADSRPVMNAQSDIAIAESGGIVASPEARDAAARALAIGDKILPADDPELARLLEIQANILDAADDQAGSAAAFERALAIYDRSSDTPRWASLAYNAADGAKKRGDCARAVPLYEKIAGLADAGKIQPVLGGAARGGLGVCHRLDGELDAATATLSSAVDELEQLGEHDFAAQFRLEMAEVEWKRGRKGEARKIAQGVKDTLTGDNETEKQLMQQADDWYLHPKPEVRGP